MTRTSHGFTLIEVTVTSAIIGILAAIALPNLQGPLHKARRTEGITHLMQLQLAQERWRASHQRYAQLDELTASVRPSLSHYRLAITEATPSTFSATATASGAQAGDTRCRVLRLTVTDGDTHHASGPDETTTNGSIENRRCWGT